MLIFACTVAVWLVLGNGFLAYFEGNAKREERPTRWWHVVQWVEVVLFYFLSNFVLGIMHGRWGSVYLNYFWIGLAVVGMVGGRKCIYIAAWPGKNRIVYFTFGILAYLTVIVDFILYVLGGMV